MTNNMKWLRGSCWAKHAASTIAYQEADGFKYTVKIYRPGLKYS